MHQADWRGLPGRGLQSGPRPKSPLPGTKRVEFIRLPGTGPRSGGPAGLAGEPERRLYQRHPAVGARIVEAAEFPGDLAGGYYVKPTIFADVTPNMTIAREEIFGPVLAIMPYDTVDQAVAIGNDTEYGLAAYVSGGDFARVREVASRLRAGQVALNGAGPDMMAPFGGFKQSGNGREWGDHAFGEFLETKAILGMPKLEAAE